MSGRADISTFDMARYGLCSMVASCSCHHLHWGFLVSVSLESCPLSGSLRQTKAFFCLTKYLASVFTVLWSNKVPFNSLFYGYAYPKQIIIFHNNLWWSERTGIECINLHLCIEMHVWPNMSDCSWQAVYHNYLFGDRQHAKRGKKGATDTISSCA